METIESRKFLKRIPVIENIVRQIVNSHGIDYDNEDIFSWEIRSVKQPDKDSHIGTTTVYKLWINNEFIVNVSPLTQELLTIINERYPIPKTELGNDPRGVIENTKPDLTISDDPQMHGIQEYLPSDEIIKREIISALRNRKDPNIGFPFADESNELAILKIAATEEGAISMKRATEGYLKGLFIITFNGLYSNPLPKNQDAEPPSPIQ